MMPNGVSLRPWLGEAAAFACLDELVGVVNDRGAGYAAGSAEERWRTAVVAFMSSGMPSPPSSALIVEALADARRVVTMLQARGHDLDEWLAGRVRLRGIRENAAVLAVLELPGRRAETAREYHYQHPDRASILGDLLTVMDQPGSAEG
jgi:hypothetical protein